MEDYKWINAVRRALEHLSAAAKEIDEDQRSALVTQAHAVLQEQQQNLPQKLIDVRNSLDNNRQADLSIINTARSDLIKHANENMPFQCQTAHGKETETIRDEHGLPVSFTRDELIKLAAEFQNERLPGKKIYKNPNARWYHTTAELNDAVIENKDGSITITFINPRIREQFLTYAKEKWPEIAENRDRLPKDYIQNHKGQVVLDNSLPNTPLSGTVTLSGNAGEIIINVNGNDITLNNQDGYTNKKTNYFLTLNDQSENKVKAYFKSDEKLKEAIDKIGGKLPPLPLANTVNSAPLPVGADAANNSPAATPH